MDIVLTGTGSPLPDANRAGPSTLVKAGDTHILVDAGRGVVMRMTGGGSNEFVVELDHPSFGPFTTSGMPLRMEKARCEVRGPSPRLAEHTADVMAEIGLDPQTVEELFAAGTIVNGTGKDNT